MYVITVQGSYNLIGVLNFASFSVRGIAKSAFHRYYIGFKQKCPPGFELHNGVCDCNKHLAAAFLTQTCDIDKVTVDCPGYTWIVYSTEGIILYVFCRPKPTKLQLDNPDAISHHCNQYEKEKENQMNNQNQQMNVGI